jgi:hypothetical protein
MSMVRYPAKGWVVFGGWLNFHANQNSEWSRDLTVYEIAEKFNSGAEKREANLCDITPAQVRYVFTVFKLNYKRR